MPQGLGRPRLGEERGSARLRLPLRLKLGQDLRLTLACCVADWPQVCGSFWCSAFERFLDLL